MRPDIGESGLNSLKSTPKKAPAQQQLEKILPLNPSVNQSLQIVALCRGLLI